MKYFLPKGGWGQTTLFNHTLDLPLQLFLAYLIKKKKSLWYIQLLDPLNTSQERPSTTSFGIYQISWEKKTVPLYLNLVCNLAHRTQYRNFPKFSDRQVWANSADPDHTRVYTVCHSTCIIWTRYSMVEPHSSNFRVITKFFWVSEYLGNLRYWLKQIRHLFNGNLSLFNIFFTALLGKKNES